MKEGGKMIKITKDGMKGEGIYIGRPSLYGNLYPTKKSKYSKKIYTLEESLKNYEQLIQTGKIDISGLIEKYNEDWELTLDCWCINRIFEKFMDVDCKNWKCHGEILAFYVFLFLPMKGEKGYKKK